MKLSFRMVFGLILILSIFLIGTLLFLNHPGYAIRITNYFFFIVLGWLVYEAIFIKE